MDKTPEDTLLDEFHPSEEPSLRFFDEAANLDPAALALLDAAWKKKEKADG